MHTCVSVSPDLHLTQEQVTTTRSACSLLNADMLSYQVSVTVNGYIASLWDCVRVKVAQTGNASVDSNITAITDSYIKLSQVIFYKHCKGV